MTINTWILLFANVNIYIYIYAPKTSAEECHIHFLCVLTANDLNKIKITPLNKLVFDVFYIDESHLIVKGVTNYVIR